MAKQHATLQDLKLFQIRNWSDYGNTLGTTPPSLLVLKRLGDRRYQNTIVLENRRKHESIAAWVKYLPLYQWYRGSFFK